MAPEVHDQPYNERCDIWSLGVLTYFLLTGQHPFVGNTVEEIVKKIRSQGNITFPAGKELS